MFSINYLNSWIKTLIWNVYIFCLHYIIVSQCAVQKTRLITIYYHVTESTANTHIRCWLEYWAWHTWNLKNASPKGLSFIISLITPYVEIMSFCPFVQSSHLWLRISNYTVCGILWNSMQNFFTWNSLSSTEQLRENSNLNVCIFKQIWCHLIWNFSIHGYSVLICFVKTGAEQDKLCLRT
jgi:hypothetical protein